MDAVVMPSRRVAFPPCRAPSTTTSSDTVVTWTDCGPTSSSTAAVSDPPNGIIRWYDPVTGRWLSNDPIGISGGFNQYVFCDNNPVNFVDPFGAVSKKKNPDGSLTITVDEGEVVILAGHGLDTAPHTLIFKDKIYGAGGFVGCFAGATNRRIDKNNPASGVP